MDRDLQVIDTIGAERGVGRIGPPHIEQNLSVYLAHQFIESQYLGYGSGLR